MSNMKTTKQELKDNMKTLVSMIPENIKFSNNTQKEVFALVYYFASKNGWKQFTAGYKQFVEDCGISYKTVSRQLFSLKALGYIDFIPGHTGQNTTFKCLITPDLTTGQNEVGVLDIGTGQNDECPPNNNIKYNNKDNLKIKYKDNIDCNANTVEESIQGKENKNINNLNNLVEGNMLYDEIRSTIEKVRNSKGVEKVNHLKHLIELRDSGKSSSAQVQMMNKWINPNINLLKDSYAFELFERCKSLYDKVRKAVLKDNHQNIILFGPEWIDSMDELHKLAKQRQLPSKITTSGDYRVKVNRQSNIYDSTVSILTEYGLMDNEQLNRKKIDAVTKLINLTLKFTSSFETRDYLIDVNLVKETFGVKVIELNKSNDLIYGMYENYFNYVNQKVEEHNQKYN